MEKDHLHTMYMPNYVTSFSWGHWWFKIHL